jgi:hypothetical protein
MTFPDQLKDDYTATMIMLLTHRKTGVPEDVAGENLEGETSAGSENSLNQSLKERREEKLW